MTPTNIAIVRLGGPASDPVARVTTRTARRHHRALSRTVPLRGTVRTAPAAEPAKSASDGATILLEDGFDDLDDARLDRLIDMPGGWCSNRRSPG